MSKSGAGALPPAGLYIVKPPPLSANCLNEIGGDAPHLTSRKPVGASAQATKLISVNAAARKKLLIACSPYPLLRGLSESAVQNLLILRLDRVEHVRPLLHHLRALGQRSEERRVG